MNRLTVTAKRWSLTAKLRLPGAYVLGFNVAADSGNPGLLLGLAHPGGGYFVGWGYDDVAPLRPWPAFFRTVTNGGAGYPLVGVSWCGFFAQKSGRRAEP